MLIENLNRPFDHAGGFFIRRTLFLQGFTFAGQPHLNGIARFNRLDKAQVFHAVVGDHRPHTCINKQPGGSGNQEVTVYHPLAKDRLRCANFVHVSIEMIPAQAGKVNDIGFRQGSARRQQAVARLQFLEVFAERMNAIFMHRRAAYPLFADGGQHGRAALNGGALHIVFDRTQATQLLAAACTSGTAVHELRKRRTVAGRLFC